MEFQYLLVAGFVLFVILWQFITHRTIENRISRIKSLFPSTKDGNAVIVEDEITKVINPDAKDEFKETLDDINSYLEKNKNKTFDYHIIEGIVNRNAELLENEVDTLLSVPLYLGLIATIFGIAFGVIAFAWKDLAQLLAATDNINPQGIKILLTDVGIAMLASLAGVYFTKRSTSNYNSARTTMVKNKNCFLTWIQTDLMSKLSDDITGAILRMTSDLNEFNRTFRDNTEELRTTLSTVNSNYSDQIKLIDRINKLNIGQIAQANIDVYSRLQGCTEVLGRLFEIISNSENYLSRVTELNDKIGSIEERTRLFEELGNYFHNEIEYVRDRQGQMRQHMSGLDSVLQDALSNLGNSLNNSLQELKTVFQNQNQNIQALIEEQSSTLCEALINQQQAVDEKIGQINEPFANVSDIFREGITGIKNAFNEQNAAINEMLETQKQKLEDSLGSQTAAIVNSLQQQQDAIIAKLNETPSQLQSLTDVAAAISKLNSNIEGLKTSISTPREIKIDPIIPKMNQEKIKWPPLMKWGIPIGLFATFIALVALIMILLFNIKL